MTERALNFDPSTYIVRLARARDMLAVFRERYVDVVVRIASLVLLSQIAIHLYGKMSTPPIHGKGVAAELARMPVGDACTALFETMAWMGPSFLIMVAALLLRRRRSVYMLDFALFDPPARGSSPRTKSSTFAAMWARRRRRAHSPTRIWSL